MKDHEAQRIPSFPELICIAIFLAGTAGVGSYFLSFSEPDPEAAVKFPSTGSVQSSYETSSGAPATLVLFIAIIFLAGVLFFNVRAKKKIEKDLEFEKEKLGEQVKELNVLNKSMVGRELKMIELKKENESLKESIKNAH